MPAFLNILKLPAALMLASLLMCAGAVTSVRAQEPVYGDVWAHDPSTMVKDGNRYYVYRTSNGIMGKWSTDLRNWTYAGQVFPSGPPPWVTNTVPDFADNTFWAPDVAYFNGKYHLYYSASSWGSIDSAIGLVTTPSLITPTWVDQGKVVQSDPSGPNTDTTTINCIDPSVLVDTNGSVWLTFGSYFDGIVVTQIDPATGKRLNGSPLTRIASSSTTFLRNNTEASFLFQRGGYYYLFLNSGNCCSGIDSTYNIRVGRSTAVTGPYLDRNNVSMLAGGGTMVLESTGRHVGPGHAGILAENGTNWFTYHYYDGNDNGAAKLGLARLSWTADGWPGLTNDWSAFYTFNVDAREHRAQYNGTLQGGATTVNVPDRGGALALNGTNAFVTLPNPVANANSFAAWVYWNGGADWQRLFDFGTGTDKYFFLSPRSGQGTMRFAITVNGGGSESRIEAPFALPTNSWVHVAVTLDGPAKRGLLYLNGQPVGTNNNLTLRPWQTMARTNNIGKSFWPDPLFNGQVDSFRVFGRTLTPADVAMLARVHPALAHRYSFEPSAGANDPIGGANGRVIGSASITNGALKLPGTTGSYFNMPGGLLSGSAAATLEFWATFGANANWARVFDFGAISGNNGANFLFYSPRTSSTTQRLGFSTSQGTANLDISGVTMDNRTVHVAIVVNPPGSMLIYTNSVLMAARTGTIPPLNSISADWAFLGRSLFTADPFLNATIDEFRIYDGRLTPAEIAVSYEAGPQSLAVPVALSIAATTPPGSSNLTLSWPAYATGYTLESATTLTGPWTTFPTPPVLVDNQWILTLSATSAPRFFRLKQP